MYWLRYALSFLMLFLLASPLPGQNKPSAEAKDVDPLALKVLRAVTQPIEQAQSFHFKALISEEELATDGQVVTLFHTTNVTMQRPDKIHLVFRGLGQRVDFYTANGKTVMFAPDAGLYTTIASKNYQGTTLVYQVVTYP
jgi:hypothetical protein